jgi:hypothetical protein
MEFDEAVLRVEEQLEKSGGFNLKELEITLPVIASYPDGFSGKAWEYGAKLMELTRQSGGDGLTVFNKIGWKMLQQALTAGIIHKKVIQILSVTQYNFVPSGINLSSVLSDPRIKTAIEAGLKIEKHPFVIPSDLGTLPPDGQGIFAELLKVVHNLSIDDELRLQWSASVLRFCAPTTPAYFVAAQVLVETLLKDERIFSAYYSFRALCESHEDLWDSDIAIEIAKAFISKHLYDISEIDVMTDFCIDVKEQSQLHEMAQLRLLTGVLGTHFWLSQKVERCEEIAWEFPGLFQLNYPTLSSTLAKYIADGDLPDMPPQYVDAMSNLETQFQDFLNAAQKELRERAYRGVPLAIKIYHDNIKNIFTPIFESIKKRIHPEKIMKKIDAIDPVELVQANERQRQDKFPIQGNLLQNMINDNFDIKKSMEAACQTLITIQGIQNKRAAIYNDQFDMYKEFDLLALDMNETFMQAFEKLLPDFWKRLNDGLKVWKNEDRYYAER